PEDELPLRSTHDREGPAVQERRLGGRHRDPTGLRTDPTQAAQVARGVEIRLSGVGPGARAPPHPRQGRARLDPRTTPTAAAPHPRGAPGPTPTRGEPDPKGDPHARPVRPAIPGRLCASQPTKAQLD